MTTSLDFGRRAQLDDLTVGTIVVDAAGRRGRITAVTPAGPPDLPARLAAVYSVLTVEDIDVLAGQVDQTPRVTRWSGGVLIDHPDDVLSADDGTPLGPPLFAVTRHGEPTNYWFEWAVEPILGTSAALRRVWLGPAAGAQ